MPEMLTSTDAPVSSPSDTKIAVGVMPTNELMIERREVEDWFANFLRRVVSNTAGPKEVLLGVKIGSDGAAYLGEALKDNTSIAELDVQWNMIGKEGVGRLAEALEVNRTITHLNLSGNSIDDTGVALVSTALAVNEGLTKVDLSGNHVGVDGASSLADALETNGTMRKLDVRFNCMVAEGCAHIARGLLTNNTLASLNISGNYIGVEGVQRLAEVQHTSSSLTLAQLVAGPRGQYCAHLTQHRRQSDRCPRCSLHGPGVTQPPVCRLNW